MKKKCVKCKKIKDLNDFYKSRNTIDGRVFSCKECDVIYSRQLRERKKKDLEFAIY